MVTDSHKLDRRQIGGISILVGNGALFANGLIARMHGDSPEIRSAGTNRMVSGLLYTGVGGIITRYGNQPIPAQLKKLQGKLAAYMKEQGVPLDAEQILKADAETQKNWFAKMEDFAYDHPMECANVYNLLSATGMLASGILRRRRGEYEAGNANIASYLLILAGTLTSVLVPERTPEQIAKSGDSGTLWGDMQKHPLNYAVWPYLAGDATFGMQAYGEFKTAKKLPDGHAFKPWAFSMAAVSAFVMSVSALGDVLTGFSSKKTGGKPEDRETAQKELIESAAKILATQPPETQKMLATQAAEFLSKQRALRMEDFDPEKLASSIVEAASHHAPTATAPAPAR